MTLKPIHGVGLSLTGGGVAGLATLLATGLGWFSSHVTQPAPDTTCLSGLPSPVQAGIGASLALAVTLAGVLTLLRAPSTSASVNIAAGKAAEIAAKASAFVLVLACCSHLIGCISAVPIEPQTPANQTQTQNCEAIATTHNDLVVGGFVLSGGAMGLGAVAAVDQKTSDRTAYAISAAIVGAFAAVDTAWTALTSSEFANGSCATYVGPLGGHR
jgi:hypothetical protein